MSTTDANANADRTVPYVPAGTIDKFFDRIKTVKPPPKVDNEWATSYGFAPPRPAAVPSMLQWLGVTGDDYVPDTETWENLRHPDTRPDTLSKLVRSGYQAVFDAVDVEQVSREQLNIEFARAYSLGSAGERVTCFLKLCEVAGIELVANGPTSRKAPDRQQTTTRRQASERSPKKRASDLPVRQPPKPPAPAPKDLKSGRSAVNVNLDVSIPAEWSSEQVRERLRVVAEAVKEFGTGET